jgi:hypothetical protein
VLFPELSDGRRRLAGKTGQCHSFKRMRRAGLIFIRIKLLKRSRKRQRPHVWTGHKAKVADASISVSSSQEAGNDISSPSMRLKSTTLSKTAGHTT